VESVTTEVTSIQKTVECEMQYADKFKTKISYNLKCFDTPGLADSKGRSKEFLNQIAETMQRNPFNQIIILVEYNRLDTGLYNNLEVLHECLNDLPDSSTMLIVNKVPTKRALENKQKRGESVPSREMELEITYEQITRALGNTFSNVMFLENDEYESDINDLKYNDIRRQLWSSKLFNAKNVKTWDQILEFYEKDIKELTEKEMEIKRKNLISNIEQKLNNVEFEIAHIKYPCLYGLKDTDSVNKFVYKFECKYTEEEYLDLISEDKHLPFFFDKNGDYKSTSRALLFLALLPFTASYCIFMGIKEELTSEKRLTRLGEKRDELKLELNEFKPSIDSLKARITLLREKIIRLESALINKNNRLQ
jgi:hypothetical protein